MSLHRRPPYRDQIHAKGSRLHVICIEDTPSDQFPVNCFFTSLPLLAWRDLGSTIRLLSVFASLTWGLADIAPFWLY